MAFRGAVADILNSRRLPFALFVVFSYFVIPYAYCAGAFDPALSLRLILLSSLILALSAGGFVSEIKGDGEQLSRLPVALTSLLVVYLAAFLLSFLPAVNKAEACLEIAKAFLFTAYTIFAVKMLSSPRRLLLVARAITASGLVMAILGIIEYWGIVRPLNVGMHPGATIFNKSLLSSYLFLALGFGFITAAVYRGVWRVIAVACFLAISYLLLMTKARAVWLGLVTAVGCFLFLSFRLGIGFVLPRVRQRIRSVMIMAAVPIMALVAGTFSEGAPGADGKLKLPDRIKTITDQHFISNAERILLWKKTVRMICNHPFSGVGAGNWKIEMPRYGIDDLLGTVRFMKGIETRPYNDFLGVFAETGIAGFIAYLGIFILAGWYLVQRGLKGGRISRLMSFILFPFLCGFVVISMLDFPRERIEHLALIGTLLAFCVSLGSRAGGGLNVPRPGRRILLAGVSVMSIACAVLGCYRLTGDIHVKKMQEATIYHEWNLVIAEADRAWSPLYTLEPTGTPLHWYRGVANFSLGKLDAAAADYEKARRYHPWHLHVLNDLGTSLGLLGDQRRAESCYVAALRVCPGFEPAKVNLAALYYNSKRFDMARKTIELCKEPHFDPRYEEFSKIINSRCKGGRT